MLRFHDRVDGELQRARHFHPAPFHSAHEAYAVILEELEEFKEQVFLRIERRNVENMYEELIQVAAMCKRTAEDLNLIEANGDER